MTLVDWLALGVLVVSAGTGMVILGLRAFDAWRAFRSLRRSIGRGLGDLTARVSGIERRVAHLGDNAAKLDDARRRLERSLSTAAVLAAAAGDAQVGAGPDPGPRAAQVTRVAAIDIGTNTTRLLVADVAGGRVDELERRSVVTRLGEGVDAQRLLLPASIARVQAALDGFRPEIDALGAEQTLAVATSAVRDARNGAAFLNEIGARYGFAIRLLIGDEEAALTRRGVGAVDEGTLVLDVGGGSTELILGDFRVSLDVGSVRLTERYLTSNPPTRHELETASAFVDSLLPELDVTAAVGVAGSVAQLSALIGELTLDAVETELELLASLPLEERRRIPNLDPGRAPVIVAGALIIVCVLRRYGLSEIAYSVRDLLDGVALEAARPREES